MIDNGYDISDFRDVDSRFGTMADLEELLQESKNLGIKVRSYIKFSIQIFVAIDSGIILIHNKFIILDYTRFST